MGVATAEASEPPHRNLHVVWIGLAAQVSLVTNSRQQPRQRPERLYSLLAHKLDQLPGQVWRPQGHEVREFSVVVAHDTDAVQRVSAGRSQPQPRSGRSFVRIHGFLRLVARRVLFLAVLLLREAACLWRNVLVLT